MIIRIDSLNILCYIVWGDIALQHICKVVLLDIPWSGKISAWKSEVQGRQTYLILIKYFILFFLMFNVICGCRRPVIRLITIEINYKL